MNKLGALLRKKTPDVKDLARLDEHGVYVISLEGLDLAIGQIKRGIADGKLPVGDYLLGLHRQAAGLGDNFKTGDFTSREIARLWITELVQASAGKPVEIRIVK